MAQEKILIRFDAKGDQKLLTAIKKLDVATKALTTSTAATTVATNSNTAATAANTVALRNQGRIASLTGRAFATLRSKMLLFNFAMGLGIRQVIQFSLESAKVEGMSNAFVTLQGAGDGASIALDRLQRATNGTMNNMELLKQANNAMVLGITKNSEEMARMFDLAQRLGRALGVDTAHAVESLITGIGRQSRLMLDNIGIVVKAEEAYEKYASNLGKTVSELTDIEKKQAFLNATLEAAESKVLEMGDEVLTASDAYSRFGSNLMNLMFSLGDAINFVLVPAMNTLSTTMEGGIDFDVARSTEDVDLLAKGIEDLEIKITSLEGHDGSFEHWLTDRAQAKLNRYRIELEMLSLRMSELAVSTEEASTALSDMGDSLEVDLIPQLPLLDKAFSRTLQGQIAFKQAELGMASALAEVNELTENQSLGLLQIEKELEDLIKKYNETGTKLEGLNDQETALLKTTTRFADVLADAALNSKNMGDAFVSAIRAMAAELAAKAAIFALMEIVFPGSGQKAAGAKSAGFDSFFKFVFAHTGGLIKNDGGIQRFANGGTVKGVDNVPIMAQAGEFVMSRRAVDAVGVETMNRINKTGSAGNINVNVSGNILTQDFVEGELADAIKKAARRGSDFGLS